MAYNTNFDQVGQVHFCYQFFYQKIFRHL